MNTKDIRASYLDYFKGVGHRIIPSSPLIPVNDPSLLFTVAGMVQFKDALLGQEELDYTRAASCQRCMRAGGKHNDLENVGFTARHLTFFEMLGNFSFGDYFKEEAITWAWEYSHQILEFDKARLWVTVHPSDDEARKIWVDKIGLPADKVVSHEDNFWAMGETGPCGPCSELFYDQGSHIAGGPPGSADEEGDRYLEFWNLVFPQFDRSKDGQLSPLAQPGVDTGMGLERVAALKQQVNSNYEIDVFKPIFRRIAEIAKSKDLAKVVNHPSYRVIADHIRSSAFLIADGILPAREGRGYVLRRIIRRAVRHGYKMNLASPFFGQLAEPLIESLSTTYPELEASSSQIKRALQTEENQFSETLRSGMKLLDRALKGVTDGVLPGDVVFKLADTYGFPVDLTEDICRERSVQIDSATYQELMEGQRQQSRANEQFKERELTIAIAGEKTEFEGYTQLTDEATVIAVFRQTDDELIEVDSLTEQHNGVLLLDRTGFYGEAGGQIGDEGVIGDQRNQFDVANTTINNNQILHHGRISFGSIQKGQLVSYRVDAKRRQDTARNHSATHLLHAALKTVLGDHVQQRGSLVAPDRLRFDFSHDNPLTVAEIERIDGMVNEEISLNSPVTTELMAFDEAIEAGAVALFGEKYGDRVRVLSMGDGFSVELCGGTHVTHTGEIGIFRVVSHSGIAAGIRRIEAVTGRQANAWINQNEHLLSEVCNSLQTNREDVLARVASLLEENATLTQALASQTAQSATDRAIELLGSAETLGPLKLVRGVVEGAPDMMMSVYDDVKSQLNSGVVVLGVVHNKRVNLVCGVTEDLVDRIRANDLIKHISPLVGARGGGRPDMARAGGGSDPTSLESALAASKTWVETQVKVDL